MITRASLRKPQFLIPAALLLLAHTAAAQTFTGKVVGIKDGDTIEVMRDGRAQTVRLHGVDTPESRQPFGTRARQLTSDIAFGKIARVEVVDTDRYGRLVGIVAVGDTHLNAELVRAGLAWWYRQYAPDDEMLARLEDDAKRNGRGLWADGEPVAPWEWRRGVRSGGGAAAAAPSAASRATLGGGDRDCGHFPSQGEAQAFFIQAGGPASDPHRLDGDRDGVACESLR